MSRAWHRGADGGRPPGRPSRVRRRSCASPEEGCGPGPEEEEEPVEETDGPSGAVGARVVAADQGDAVAGGVDGARRRREAGGPGVGRAAVDLRLELEPGSGRGGWQGTQRVDEQ